MKRRSSWLAPFWHALSLIQNSSHGILRFFFFNQSESALQTELNYLMLHVCLFQLYWMRMSEPNPITVGTYVYSPDTRFSVTKDHTSTHWDLRIRNVKLEDAGVYFCAVSSGEGREKHRRLIKLNVKGRYRVKPVGRKTCFPIN